MKTYMCGGIGDMICMDSVLTQEERESITEIYWGHVQQHRLAYILDNNKFYKNLKKHYFLNDETARNLFPDDSAKNMWHYRGDISEHFDIALRLHNISSDQIRDWTCINFFNRENYTGSTFMLNAQITDLDWHKYNLKPFEYILCQTSSSVRPGDHKHQHPLNATDWGRLHQEAVEKKLKIVAITDKDMDIPIPDVTLLKFPDLKEIICLAKYCHSYAGIDSFVSILAAKVLPADKLYIKHFLPDCSQRIPNSYKSMQVHFLPHKLSDILKFYVHQR